MAVHHDRHTDNAVREIVAQHLPGVSAEVAPHFAGLIMRETPIAVLGITDGRFVALTMAIEAEFGFDLPDCEWEAVKTVADVFDLVGRYATKEAVA